MRILRRKRTARILLACLYGLAMLLMPLAHSPSVGPSSTAGIDLSAYALPDGSAPVLCSTVDGKSGLPGKSRLPGVCDACRLTSAPGLVVAGLSLPGPETLEPLRLGAPLRSIGVDQDLVTVARARAPPAPLA